MYENENIIFRQKRSDPCRYQLSSTHVLFTYFINEVFFFYDSAFLLIHMRRLKKVSNVRAPVQQVRRIIY